MRLLLAAETGDGVTLRYHLVRSARRSIGLRVDAAGLMVRAPLRATQAAIDDVVRRHAHWVQRKLAEHAARVAAAPPPPDWVHGAELAYRGHTLTLVLDAQACAPIGWPTDPADGANLVLRLAPDAPAAQVRALVGRAWQQQALIFFRSRLAHFAPVLGVRWHSLALSNARTTWGSARRDGRIRLNQALLQLDDALIDYVVVHELAHLREMNHSARFWAVVHGVLPDADERRARLRAARPTGLHGSV